jgi:hypothetical protein
MKLLKVISCVMIVIASTVLGGQIILNARSNQESKNDYAEINHVKYGLFSIEKWKRQITAILVQEINALDL